MAHKPEELQEVLQYTFKNPALLRIAMTHTSYANESKVATTHNERLEFLGDSVLSVVVADYLFHQSGRPEGELTRMRASSSARRRCSSSRRRSTSASICALAMVRISAAGATAPALSPMRLRPSSPRCIWTAAWRSRAALSCPSSPRARPRGRLQDPPAGGRPAGPLRRFEIRGHRRDRPRPQQAVHRLRMAQRRAAGRGQGPQQKSRRAARCKGGAGKIAVILPFNDAL